MPVFLGTSGMNWQLAKALLKNVIHEKYVNGRMNSD